MGFDPRALIHSRKLAWISNMIKFLIKRKEWEDEIILEWKSIAKSNSSFRQ